MPTVFDADGEEGLRLAVRILRRRSTWNFERQRAARGAHLFAAALESQQLVEEQNGSERPHSGYNVQVELDLCDQSHDEPSYDDSRQRQRYENCQSPTCLVGSSTDERAEDRLI